jgi:hypothetical protein
MKLISEFCRRRLAARRWLIVGAGRSEHGFVVTVPPPLAASAAAHAATHAAEVAKPPVPSPSFAPLGR